MRKLSQIWFCFLTAVLLFSSCEYKELTYNYPYTTEVRINVDWSKFTPYEIPTGMTLILYPQSLNGNAVTHLTNTTSHAILSLPVSRYHLLVFNQSITEFGSISFRGLDKMETAEVFATEYQSRWYTSRNENEKVVSSIEWLGVGNSSDAEVTQEMVDAGTEAMLRAGTSSSQPVIASLTPVNVIKTVDVKLHISGIQNLRSARASLNGMAEGYHLTTLQPTDGKVTHLMESWSMKRDAADPTKGILETSFTCFGFPNGHQGQAEENLLSVSFLLVDNKTIQDYSFQVGDLFVSDDVVASNAREVGLNHETINFTIKLDLDTHITLPDVKPEGSASGGFNATVDDWGDEEEYELNI